jgi:hypothetical protein
VVEDIKSCANISDLLQLNRYLAQVDGISTPHVFHIKPFPQAEGMIHVRAGIYTKGLWSTSLSADPWSTQPFFLLQKPIIYTSAPPSQMRGPPEEYLRKIKQGVNRFSELQPDETSARAELEDCVNELERACDGTVTVPFNWNLSDGEPIYMCTEVGECSREVIIDGPQLVELRDKITGKRKSCSPVKLGIGTNELISRGKRPRNATRDWFLELSLGDFVCVDADDDSLDFYVGKVISIFQYSEPAEEWEEAYRLNPNSKFLEVHWWEPQARNFGRGYDGIRLYPATRPDNEGKCHAHINVGCESSVLYCFQKLTSEVDRHGTAVSGIMT